MFVYEHKENEEFKNIYESTDLGCLLHFIMFGVDLKRAPKKRKIDLSEDECEVKKTRVKKIKINIKMKSKTSINLNKIGNYSQKYVVKKGTNGGFWH